jgi:endonuclease/exonuclease/phosphatase family metal-dependent hydrolase
MIKLMSFNIRYRLAEDGDNRWEQRRSLVIDRIRTFDPDLIGLQECRADAQAEFIQHNLQDYEFLGEPRGGDSETSVEMAPILIKRSAFQIRQWETFWLSETPYIPGSKSWGSVFPRTVTWVDLLHRDSDRLLTFVNTHFDYEPSAIQASAQLLKEWTSDAIELHPLLITGDFNADKSSLAYRQLTSGKPPLKDVFRAGSLKHENEGTFHGYGAVVPPQSIDWILVSSHFSVLEATIDRYRQGDLFPSDHYSVAAMLDWITPQK